jgi:hypothetical protein
VAQIGELNPFVALLDLAMVIRRVQPCRAKGIIGCQQPLDIAAHRLLWTKPLDALLRPFAIQFIGIRRDMPRLCCYFQKQPVPGEGVK